MDVIEIMNGFPEFSEARIVINSGKVIIHTKFTQHHCDHSRPQTYQRHLQRSIAACQLLSVESKGAAKPAVEDDTATAKLGNYSLTENDLHDATYSG